MATKKKAASKGSEKDKTKRTKKRTVADSTRSLRLADEDEHSPIIITDGSASIEFTESEYPHQGNGHHTSKALLLRNVSASRSHPISPPIAAGDPRGSTICQSFTGTTRFRIEVTVRVDGTDETFTVMGRSAGSFKSPTIDFNLGQFRKDHASFPPKFPQTGSRFVNPTASITSLRIFRGSTLVHDCPLASVNGIEYTINDPHG